MPDPFTLWNQLATLFPQLLPFTLYIPIAFGLAALVARFLAPPTSTSPNWYVIVYVTVNWLGQNSGHATNGTAPVLTFTVPKVPTAAAAIALAGSLSACAAVPLPLALSAAEDLYGIAKGLSEQAVVAKPSLAPKIAQLTAKGDQITNDAEALVALANSLTLAAAPVVKVVPAQ